MLGGYQILDLRAIDLTVGTSASNITDANVLKQLRELRNHIQKDYNFAKPLNNQLKPVLIRYRDKKNGEKHEVALYGNLEVLTNYYTFKINALGHGEKLSIEVVFEEKTDEYENKYWDIKTAKVLLSIDEAIGGDASIGGDLSVTGDASIGGDMSVTGDVSGAKFIGVTALESIKDAEGHNRFIEGDIDLYEGVPEGYAKVYGKWSLSGTHLMIVICFTIPASTTTGYVGRLCDLTDLPSWIVDKIVPIGNTYIETKIFNGVMSDDSLLQVNCQLRKRDGTTISISQSSVTTTSALNVRVAFDLLIDNEAQE